MTTSDLSSTSLTRTAGAVVALAAIGVTNVGCLAAGLYTTPDTLEPKRVQVVAAPEAWNLKRTAPPESSGLFGARTQRDSGESILPASMIRVGIADGAEIGVGVARADVKVRLFRGDVLRLAIDPIVRGVHTQDGLGAVAELPLLVGVRIGDHVLVVGNAGPGYVHFIEPDGPALSRLTARAGGGIRVQLQKHVALQPEIAYVRSLSDGNVQWVSGGLAIVAGGIP